MEIQFNEKGQAIAPKSQLILNSSFNDSNDTSIYWLGGSGTLIHSHDVNIMIDPVLQGFDMPLLYTQPITVDQIMHLDGVLITHIDNDHYSKTTCSALNNVTTSFYAPNYVGEVMLNDQLKARVVDIDQSFTIKDLKITPTAALHNWQNGVAKWQFRYWDMKDYCGYEIETKDGIIWMPGDSKLLECQLTRRNPDVILFDFSDNDWHIGFEGAIKLANTYVNADLICIHWGCVDAPTMTPFNANPLDLVKYVNNPQRIHVLAPGEKFILNKFE